MYIYDQSHQKKLNSTSISAVIPSGTPPPLTPRAAWKKISLYEAASSAFSFRCFHQFSHSSPCIVPLFLHHFVHRIVLLPHLDGS